MPYTKRKYKVLNICLLNERLSYLRIVIFFTFLISVAQAWPRAYVLLDDVSQGQAYGFKIAEDKAQTFARAKKLYEADFISSWRDLAGLCALESDEWLLVPIIFSKPCERHLLSTDDWWFYVNHNYLDSIRLTFRNNKLVRIYRHRHFNE